jgi:hypothetical protein
VHSANPLSPRPQDLTAAATPAVSDAIQAAPRVLQTAKGVSAEVLRQVPEVAAGMTTEEGKRITEVLRGAPGVLETAKGVSGRAMRTMPQVHNPPPLPNPHSHRRPQTRSLKEGRWWGPRALVVSRLSAVIPATRADPFLALRLPLTVCPNPSSILSSRPACRRWWVRAWTRWRTREAPR